MERKDTTMPTIPARTSIRPKIGIRLYEPIGFPPRIRTTRPTANMKKLTMRLTITPNPSDKFNSKPSLCAYKSPQGLLASMSFQPLVYAVFIENPYERLALVALLIVVIAVVIYTNVRKRAKTAK
jgi:hypothetical protein